MLSHSNVAQAAGMRKAECKAVVDVCGREMLQGNLHIFKRWAAVRATGSGGAPKGVILESEQIEIGTGGGSRTHTALRPADFESAASAIPPLRHGRFILGQEEVRSKGGAEKTERGSHAGRSDEDASVELGNVCSSEATVGMTYSPRDS
jgi:hypothetical protein